MTPPDRAALASGLEHRALVYSPTGKDGRLIAKVLDRASLLAYVGASAGDIVDELAKGAGCVVVADEALTTDFLRAITEHLAVQPAWSDLPVLVLSKRGLDSPAMRNIYLRLGNVTLLERPVQSITLVSAVSSALRARKRQYEMRKVDRRKDEFLAMLAHELRNPLAPIAAASDLLSYVDLERRQIKETSEIISRQVAHMTGLIDDLLDVSRVSRGLVALEQTLLDVRQVVSNALEQVRPLIDTRRHRLAVHIPPEAALVRGDQKRLIQVLTNLLNNAAKYSLDGGSIRLTVEVEPNDVVIRIDDEGIGMTQDTVAHVFEMFTQAERTPDRSQGGLGIGLALVRSLVELHGGKVAAFSAGLGKGSEFTVVLPRAAEPAALAAAGQGSPAAQPAKGRRLLLVDDNVDAARLLAMLLEASGYEVMVEHNAQGALLRAQACAPDACLLDIGLPDMDGNELARQLRSPEGAGPTLIAITGYGQEQDRKRTSASGFDFHFVKPVKTEQLLHVLSTLT
ncbi:MAG TPA: ATP-binding protein [Noviherbaspirillum sp.]|uniref:hybrid sensor histidine kinase/response regulator n=1 Tax=Noviherbaspirillum sp. TaxID=1926288 RepID=UPI002F94F4AD